MTEVLVGFVTVQVRTHPPVLVQSCILQVPGTPTDPGDGQPVISPPDLWIPIAPTVPGSSIPNAIIIEDDSPSRIIGCIYDASGDPQGKLDALFPNAIPEDGVIERLTNDIWALREGSWKNVGPTPGPRVVTSNTIPPFNEITLLQGSTGPRLDTQSLPYALQLLTEPGPIIVRTKLEATRAIDIPSSILEVQVITPEITADVPTLLDISSVATPFAYVGTGSEQSISGLFRDAPGVGMVMVRRVSLGSIDVNKMYDTSRGPDAYWNVGSFTLEQVAQDSVKSFDSNGFTVGADTLTNENGIPYAGHAFRATSEPVLNTQGTIDAMVAKNRAYSIITYTGTGVAASIGHGLASAPQMVWIANLSNVTASVVGGPVVGDESNLVLSSTAGRQTGTEFLIRTTTSSAVNIGAGFGVNSVDTRYVAYAFASVPAVSKIDTYVGNGDPAGLFVDCGFEVDFLLVKYRNGGTVGSAATEWVLIDRTDLGGKRIYSLREGGFTQDTVQFYALEGNGFRAMGSDSRLITNLNNNGATYVFMAFARRITRRIRIPATNIDITVESDVLISGGASVQVDPVDIQVLPVDPPGAGSTTVLQPPSRDLQTASLPPALVLTASVNPPQQDISFTALAPAVQPTLPVDVSAITYSQSSVWPDSIPANNEIMTNGSIYDAGAATDEGDPPTWVQMDLGSVFSIGKVIIGTGTDSIPGGWDYTYTTVADVQYSSDTISWTTAFNTGQLGGEGIYEFNVDFSARYIRIIYTEFIYLAVSEFYALAPGQVYP